MPEPQFRTLDDMPADLTGQRVLVRVDFNVPVDDQDRITDDTRIRGALPTLRELGDRGARVVVMSHRGRPKGWGGASLEGAAERLGELLHRPCHFVDDITGHKAREAVAALQPGEYLVLQNLRYDPGEKSQDAHFARALAELGDWYVNDAFGTAHRADASVALLPRLIPGYAGRLMERELKALSVLQEGAAHPYWAVIGGSKVSDKVGLLGALLSRVDGLIIGGGMANTFLAAQGYNMGASRVEADALATARDILAKAQAKGIPVLLPEAVVAAQGFRPDAPSRVVPPGELGAEEMALDIAPEAVDRMLAAVSQAKTIFWNGPMGVFEWKAFSQGTMRMAQGLAALSAHVVVGGGDSVAAVTEAGVQDRLAHVSTGGGATLALLEGQTLPGIQALTESVEG
ncbi:MAG: phosphoglycerate kinase [Firmicutes bacterium]|nr:phosphoglycerate kinase [Bacillota bacterium]